ncbi:hypothetical protein HZZ00_12990 [Streptomyces sp. NEAU-sy36]|uniref:hypothetical protein n=1 Tax=Streptomyces sp. NEAU-sy36 TaxID=2751189 RepID=UPI0015D5722C|nr:hypothetical protein [Streptomyces sp. NEAU-sy36]QLJ01851.1 hypothetical protein HZZ00_12990 [Streptomyces sp. NEAU-sy36]
MTDGGAARKERGGVSPAAGAARTAGRFSRARTAVSPEQRAVAVRGTRRPWSVTRRLLQTPYQAATDGSVTEAPLDRVRSQRPPGEPSFGSGWARHRAPWGSRVWAAQPLAGPTASDTGTGGGARSESGSPPPSFGTTSGSAPQPGCRPAESTSGTLVSYTARECRAVA